MVRGMKLTFAFALLVGAASSRADDKKAADLPFDDTTFAKKATVGGMVEVEMGKIAVAQAKNDDVKKFGQMLIKDHTKANGELMAAAKAAGIAVPDKIDDEHQKHIDKFKNYKGDNFDSDFISHMVTDHEKDIALFTRASKEAKHAELKDFATQTLPTLQKHLEMAKKLQK